MGVIQFTSLAIATLVPISNYHTMTWLSVIYSFSGAFLDVIADGLMVIEARKDPISGS